MVQSSRSTDRMRTCEMWNVECVLCFSRLHETVPIRLGRAA